MKKSSTKKSNKQLRSPKPLWRKLWDSRMFWRLVLLALGLGAAGLLYLATTTGDPLKNTYNDLSIPPTWQRTSYDKDDGIKCVFADLTCPSLYADFNVSAQNIDRDFYSITQSLSRHGFQVDTCILSPSTDRCQGDYYVDAKKYEISLSIYTTSDNPVAVHLSVK